MTTNQTKKKSLAATAATLPMLIAKLDAAQCEIREQMAVLKRKGLIYATPHFREGKYLYLLYPLKAGEPRRREYVGTDPKRIKASEDGIERAKEYDRLTEQLRKFEQISQGAHANIAAAVARLTTW